METDIELLKMINDMDNQNESLHDDFEILFKKLKELEEIEEMYKPLREKSEKSVTNFINEENGPVDHKKLSSLLFKEITARDLLAGNIEEQRNTLLKLFLVLLVMAGNKGCNEGAQQLILSSAWQQISKMNLNNSKGGQATKAKHRHLTDVAINIIKQFSEDNPKWLNDKVCARGVKSNIDGLIEDKMRKKTNYKKANFMTRPTIKTIQKHRNIAFKELGFNK
jgi:hypothetical protein